MTRMTNLAAAKTVLLPNARFPEFSGMPRWEPRLLADVSNPVTERVGDRRLTSVSISAGIGFVPQAEKFGRDISGNQYHLYTLIRDGDFVYNKGNSLSFPQGCVYQLQGLGEVAAPNVFISFRLKEGYCDGFFRYCFEHNLHGIQLKRHITSGARSNGLLNISKEHFFGITIPTPSLAEQLKIAECLSTLDELIGAERQKLDALKSHKQGLMQQIFPLEGETVPRLRFPEFHDESDWEEAEVGDLFTVTRGQVLAMPLVKRTRTDESPYPVYSSQTKSSGLCGFYSDFLFEDAITWTTDGANAGDVNYRPGKFYCTNVCGVLLSSRGFVNPCMAELINRVARRHVSYVGNPKLMNGAMARIVVPVPSLAEQTRISSCLSSLDGLIATQANQIDVLKTHKQGLMQQLFPVLESVGP